jgi:hypothetical protein
LGHVKVILLVLLLAALIAVAVAVAVDGTLSPSTDQLWRTVRAVSSDCGDRP